MEYSIGALARLSGVTTRTLRWYDEIGLLKPARTDEAGQRFYGEREAARLWDILLYRSMGMELSDIREWLDNPSFDRCKALREHLKALRKERARLDGLIEAVEQEIGIQEVNMGKKRNFEAFKRQAVEENERKYGQEVRAKYGNAEADAANARMMNMTEEAHDEWTALDCEILRRLEAAVSAGVMPQSEEGRELAMLHKKWITHMMHGYDVQRHRGIVQLYVMDERFTAYYDKKVSGCAAFLRNAVLEWVK